MDPLSGAAGSLIASMGNFAVGFGTMLVAPTKALYSIALKRKSTPEEDSVSNSSKKPVEMKRISDLNRKSILRILITGGPLEKSKSEPPSPRSVQPSKSVEYEDVGQKGLGKMVKATAEGFLPYFWLMFILFLAPVAFTVAMAQGLHNLPLLYGQSVRPVSKVRDFSSGVKTGGKVAISLIRCLR
jgi:hypothetical protein